MSGSRLLPSIGGGTLLTLLSGLAASPAWAAPGAPDATASNLPEQESPLLTVDLRAPAEPAPAPGGPHTFVGDFEEALDVRTDLLLEGVDAEAHVDFTVPESWELLEDPILLLEFAHSPALLPERSHLTATLNGQAIGSVRLDTTNGRAGVMSVRVPRALLSPYNHLRVSAVQHYGATCEDPFDPGLWTRVKNTSSIAMRYRPKDVVPELARFPFPLFDETGYGPANLSLVLAATPSAAAIEAVGRLGVTMGRIADYRGVRLAGTVATTREADTNALLVGTWSEMPELRSLLGEVALRPSQGLVAMVPHPDDPARAVLVVTGADAEGLSRAALAVASQGRHEVLAGPQARVDFVADGNPPTSRRVPRHAPAQESFSLATLGIRDQTVRGFYTSSVQIPLDLEGDAAIRPGGAEAELHYAYAAGLDPRLSAMEVRLDGVTVKSVALDAAGGDADASVRVELPDGVMTPRSTLEVAFTLFPTDFDACAYVSDKTLWATVFASSSVSVERDSVATLPDLGRLRYGAWPFTLDPADGGVIAALSDRPTASEVGAGFLLGAALGRMSPAEQPSFRLAPAAGLDFATSPDANFILLSTGAPHTLHEALLTSGALAISGGADRTLMAGGERAISATISATDGIVEEALHPANPTRAALVLAASEPVGLADLVAAISEPDRVTRLDGNVAMVAPDGGVRTLATAEKRQVGSYPIGVTLVLLAREHWALLGAGIVAGAILFATVKRAWVRAKEA
jgi:hypothetical protein